MGIEMRDIFSGIAMNDFSAISLLIIRKEIIA